MKSRVQPDNMQFGFRPGRGTKNAYATYHHHHLFLKRPFLPRSARVRRFSCYEASHLKMRHPISTRFVVKPERVSNVILPDIRFYKISN